MEKDGQQNAEEVKVEVEVPDSTFEDSFSEATGVEVEKETPVKVDEKPLESEKKVEGQVVEPDYKVLLEKEQQRVKSWEGRLSAAERRNNELNNKLQEIEKGHAIKTDESVVDVDDPLIKGFVDEMGSDFIKPLDAYIKRQINEAIKPFKNLQDKLPVIEKQVSTIDEGRVNDHYGRIFDAHNDVKEILDSGELDTYIDDLPYSKAVVKKQIMLNGSTKQVIDLLTEFKENTGKVKQEDVKPKISVVPKVSKEDINAATAVKGGSYIVPKGKAAQDDFEGAFAEAVSSN